MLNLLLSILSGAMLSIVMRLSEGRVKARTFMLCANYCTCMLLSGMHMGFDLSLQAPRSGLTLLLGCINGVIYVVSLLLMQYNIRCNGIVLPSVFSRLGGLMVPLAVSMLFFAETPEPLQLVGAALAIGAILLINGGGGSVTALMPLLLLFLGDGMAAGMSKIYGEVGSAALSAQFLFFTFASALVFCTAAAFVRGERPGWQELLYGVAIGVPNFYASRFLLMALEQLPAVVVYPTRGVGGILVVTLVGVAVFGERLKKRQWLAMGVILAAVTLLNL